MLNIVMLNIVMLNIVMLNIVMLNLFQHLFQHPESNSGQVLDSPHQSPPRTGFGVRGRLCFRLAEFTLSEANVRGRQE